MQQRLAEGYARRVPDSLADDLRSAAKLGVVFAAATHDPSRGAPFRAHACLRAKGEIRRFLCRHGDFMTSLDSAGPEGRSPAGSVPLDLERGGF